MKNKLLQTLGVCLAIGLSNLAIANEGGGGNVGSFTGFKEELRAVKSADLKCHFSVILPQDATEAIKSKYNKIYEPFQECTDFGGSRECLDMYEVPIKTTYNAQDEYQSAKYDDQLISISISLAPKNLVYNQAGYSFVLKKEKVEMSGFYPLWDRDWVRAGAILDQKYSGIRSNIRYAIFMNAEGVGFMPECKVSFK